MCLLGIGGAFGAEAPGNPVQGSFSLVPALTLRTPDFEGFVNSAYEIGVAECRSGVPPPVLISDWIHGGGMLWYPGADSFPSWLWDYFQFADYSSPGLSLAWVQAFLNCGFVLPAVPRSYEGTLLSYVCGYWYEYEYGSKGGSPSDFLFDPSGKLIPENLVLKTELSFLQDEVENLTDEVQNLEVRLRKASVIGVVFAAGFVGICCWNSFLKKPNSMISFHKLK